MIDRLRRIVSQLPWDVLEGLPRQLRSWPDGKNLAFMLAIVAAFLLLSLLLHMPHGPQHWTADIVTALGSPRPTTQHKKIALVYVSEETLKPYPYLSPTNRELLADLLKALDDANPLVIGWDFVIDRQTEPDKDRALKDVINSTNTKMVLGAIHTPDAASEKYQREFLHKINPKHRIGHLHFDAHHNPLTISDHVVRKMPEQHGREPYPTRFVSAIAEQAGVRFEPRSRYIAWLLTPGDGSEQFLTLSAEQVLGRTGPPLPLADLLGGKIVLVGGNFSDRDQHLTPLSIFSHERSTGLFIHAQMLAQLLERRSMHETGPVMQIAIVIISFGFGLWVGRSSQLLPLVIELASVATLVFVAGLAFVCWSYILPYNAVVISWLAGLAAGHYGKAAHA